MLAHVDMGVARDILHTFSVVVLGGFVFGWLIFSIDNWWARRKVERPLNVDKWS